MDTLEEIDEKFPKYQDPIGLKKPQWVKDLEEQEGSVDYSSIIVFQNCQFIAQIIATFPNTFQASRVLNQKYNIFSLFASETIP